MNDWSFPGLQQGEHHSFISTRVHYDHGWNKEETEHFSPKNTSLLSFFPETTFPLFLSYPKKRRWTYPSHGDNYMKIKYNFFRSLFRLMSWKYTLARSLAQTPLIIIAEGEKRENIGTLFHAWLPLTQWKDGCFSSPDEQNNPRQKKTTHTYTYTHSPTFFITKALSLGIFVEKWWEINVLW